MKLRVRFGIKGALWFFPNAGVIVVYMSSTNYARFSELVSELKAIIEMSGNKGLAEKVVCEVS